MPKTGPLAAGLAIVLAACSGANAAPLDSGNDVHCYAMASGFGMLADIEKAPAYQRHAIFVLESWYGARLDRIRQLRGADEVTREAAPVIRAFDSDLSPLKAAFRACADRATSDPGFDKFAERRSRR
jgi:hypothetical protein